MLIVLDMDDILVQTNQAWLDAYNIDYDDDRTLEDIRGWNIHYWVKPECGMKIYDYLSKPGFYFNMEPVDGALDGAVKLSYGNDIVIATASPIRSSTAVEEKKDWLRDYMPWFKLSNFIVCHRKELINGDMLFDDGAHNLRDFRGTSVCLDRPWNRGEQCADVHVESWFDFLHFIERYKNDEDYRLQTQCMTSERLTWIKQETGWRYDRE